MRVLKFGGTSVGSAASIHQVSEILSGRAERQIVVFSAMAGTTNALVDINDLLNAHQTQKVFTKINALELHYMETAEQLFNANFVSHAKNIINQEIEILRTLCSSFKDNCHNSNTILTRGEYLSCNLIHLYLEQQNISSRLIDATTFIRLDKNGQPDYSYTAEHLARLLSVYSDDSLFITQGYVCIDQAGQASNLGRGGSDFTATIIGSAIHAAVVEIWTDIDGLHNNDPRFVAETYPIAELSYEEAEELAYFGAKILHPTCIFPLKQKAIPLNIKNTFKPKSKGTLIHDNCINEGFKSVASKDNIIVINIKSARMMMAYGFLRRIFTVFEDFKCPVDMITTSEIAVSVTIDEHPQLAEMVIELEKLGEVKVYNDQSIICVVGAFTHNSKGLTSIINKSLSTIPLRMISYGASQNNICLLVDSKYKTNALNLINEQVFNVRKEVVQ